MRDRETSDALVMRSSSSSLLHVSSSTLLWTVGVRDSKISVIGLCRWHRLLLSSRPELAALIESAQQWVQDWFVSQIPNDATFFRFSPCFSIIIALASESIADGKWLQYMRSAWNAFFSLPTTQMGAWIILLIDYTQAPNLEHEWLSIYIEAKRASWWIAFKSVYDNDNKSDHKHCYVANANVTWK